MNQDIGDEFNNGWIKILEQEVVDFNFNQYAIVRNENLFDENVEWKNKLILNKDNFGGSINYVEEGIVLIDRILEGINKELD